MGTVDASGARPPWRALVLATVAGIAALAVVVVVAAIAVSPGDGGDTAGVVRLTRDEPGTDNPLLNPPVTPGERVPELTFTRFDGITGSFADYAGRPLVVNFFASWCAPCVREMPEFEAVHRAARAAGVDLAFLGIAENDSRSDALAIVERTGVTYDLADDPTGELLVAFRGSAMPTTVLVNPDGTIAARRSGELSGEALRTLIAEHFGITLEP